MFDRQMTKQGISVTVSEEDNSNGTFYLSCESGKPNNNEDIDNREEEEIDEEISKALRGINQLVKLEADKYCYLINA